MQHFRLSGKTTDLGFPIVTWAISSPFCLVSRLLVDNAESFTINHLVDGGERSQTALTGTWTVRDNKVRLLLIDPVEGEVILKLDRPAHECAKLLVRHLNAHLNAQLPHLS